MLEVLACLLDPESLRMLLLTFKVLKLFIWIAEKWANKSSPPSSGVIKPKPLESLNHFTVPVAIIHLSNIN